MYLSTKGHTVLKFCFEHLVVTQKRKKHSVPNMGPVMNKHPPPLEIPKVNKYPGCQLESLQDTNSVSTNQEYFEQ